MAKGDKAIKKAARQKRLGIGLAMYARWKDHNEGLR
jgi:hypothetical protein